MPSDGSIPTAEGSSRKRVKISQDSGRPAGNSSSSPEVISLISSPTKKPVMQTFASNIQQNGHAKDTSCHHEQSLRNLHGDLDAMRGLITCKICDRFLYEPYSLTCGHTYCYSCLSSWMVDNKKKTCPDCRSIIKDQPAPSYVIREMVHIFRSKSELLADGETSEEHIQLAKEEADIVLRDKSNTDGTKGGLFKGHFKRGGALVRMQAIRDNSDNVFRCPQCVNEVEDGWCLHCHVRVTTGEDDDDSDDDTFSNDSLELDHDLEADDHDIGHLDGDFSDYSGYEDYLREHPDVYGGHGYPDHRLPYDLYSEEESDDESDQDLTDGFIVDDTTIAGVDNSEGESDGTEREVQAPRSPRRPRPLVLSDDDDEEGNSHVGNQHPSSRRRRLVAAFRGPNVRPGAAASSTGSSQTSDSEEDEDDEGPIPANSQRNRRRLATRTRRPILIASDEDDSDGVTETTSRSVAGGFSPLQSEEGFEDENGENSRRRSVSVTSGMTDNSMMEEDDDDGLSDDSDDQNITTNLEPRPYTHRLHTLGSRSVRHTASATRRLGLSAQSPIRDTIPLSANRRPQLPAGVHASGNMYHRPLTSEDPYPQTGPNNPAHPFGLASVLNRIQQRTEPRQIPPNPYVNTSRRTRSNVSSQSSLGGGVDVRSHGSSESSRTVRASDDPGYGPRRRRFQEIDEAD